MENATISVETLKNKIATTEKELLRLRAQLAVIENQNAFGKEPNQHPQAVGLKYNLLPEEYIRYGRQMIVPNIGIQGQLRLRSASVLIIGAGGLGCPAAAYLAGAGIGKIGLVDGDIVELSNLHRQIIHNCETLGMNKVDSAVAFLKRLNPHCQYKAYATRLTAQNAEEITSEYDLVLDCTDHPTSRYLISDISSLLMKPLISASALRGDGQLILLNWPPLVAGNENGGPCYRCIFPKPPPIDSVISCGQGGIIGPVVGVMGVLQALEAVKLLTYGKLVNSTEEEADYRSTMLLFSTGSEPSFRSVRLKGRKKDCLTCSDKATVSLAKLRNGKIDYQLFCGISSIPNRLLDAKYRIQVSQYAKQIFDGHEHLLVDVREKVQFEICSLPGSINVPFSTLKKKFFWSVEDFQRPNWLPDYLSPNARIFIICRSGIDSQVVAKQLIDGGIERSVMDIIGGFKAWKEEVDPSWPEY